MTPTAQPGVSRLKRGGKSSRRVAELHEIGRRDMRRLFFRSTQRAVTLLLLRLDRVLGFEVRLAVTAVDEHFAALSLGEKGDVLGALLFAVALVDDVVDLAVAELA